MSLDLNKLANKLDEALIKETTETLTKFLNDKRMSKSRCIYHQRWLVISLISSYGENRGKCSG